MIQAPWLSIVLCLHHKFRFYQYKLRLNWDGLLHPSLLLFLDVQYFFHDGNQQPFLFYLFPHEKYESH